MAKVKSVVDTILGEATYGTPQQRYTDMVNIASVIANRAAQTRTTPQQVVSVRSEFNAYGKPLPAGVEKYRSLAQQALDDVLANGPKHNATFYATPKAAKNLPKGLKQVASTSGHVYFADPQNRAIRTAVGFVKPVANAVQQVAKQTVNTLGDVANAVTAPVRQVAAGAGNIASALRTAAFPSMSPPPRPSVPVGNNAFGSYSRANLTPGISNALDVLSYAPQAANIGINSGYRSPTTNAKAGGASRSQHLHGNAVDIDISRLSPADRTALLDLAIEKGNVKGVGVYPSGNSLHIDTRGNPKAWGPSPRGKYSGLSPKELNQLPEWAQDSIKGMYQAGSFRVTPRTTAPTPTARPSPPETMMAAPVGRVERAPLQAAAPRMPDAARFAYDTQPNPERFGPRTQTTTATTARLPSSSMPEPNPARFAYDVPTAKTPAPERFGYGLVSPAAAATPQAPNANMSLADQYASYGAGRVPNPTPALNAMMSPKVGPLPQSFNPVAGSLMAPISPPTLQPPAPAPVTTPTMPRLPSPINQRINQAVNAPPPSVPQYTAADVYAGRANSGVATGGNMVSRDQFGNTSVTNKYGVTTTTNANGQQMASGGPGIGGPLGSGGIGSVFDAQPDLNGRSKFGNTARQVGASMAGSAVGGLLGPIGSLLGAAIAGELAKPGAGRVGDLLNGVRTMNINGQQMQFARPQSGGAFPNAPSGGFRDPTFSNRSDRSMRDISPKAARDIKSGTAGLF
nr:D-Ala-D-Ala carboxypeptidase family metallohydrolase [Aminobacter aminovorans]